MASPRGPILRAIYSCRCVIFSLLSTEYADRDKGLQVEHHLYRVDEHMLTMRAFMAGRIIDGARIQIHVEIGKSAERALTFLTLDSYKVHRYLSYIYADKNGPAEL